MRRSDEDELIRKAKRSRDTITEVVKRLAGLLARDSEPAGRDGYPASSGVPGRTSDSRPTEVTAMARCEHGDPPDPYHDRMVEIARLLNETAARCAGLRLELAKLDRLGDVRAAAGGAVCVNPHCDHVITGVGDDRLRKGRCAPCARYLTRTGRDRTARTWDEVA